METIKDSQRIEAFVASWNGKGYEKGDTQLFWMELLGEVLGVGNPTSVIVFEKKVELGHTSFIDAYLPETRVLVEQKSLEVDLDKPKAQSDGTELTPYGQAKRYADMLPYDERPRWIIVSNFAEIRVHDMQKPTEPPFVILLDDLPKEAHLLSFLINDHGSTDLRHEMEVSFKAGEIVGKLYEALRRQYTEPTTEELHSINMLCVRIVFCLYAEDAAVFGKHQQFGNYMRVHSTDPRTALQKLFRILDQKPQERDKFEDEDLLAFPYVNGGLFNGEVQIPRLTNEIFKLLVRDASEEFDWSQISPTIFGAVFESTLNPETRRAGGMHYTSIENIHKVIDPLFLDALKDDYTAALAMPDADKRRALVTLQARMAALQFLDPACGSGNFLTESFLSLRRLENNIIRQLMGLGDLPTIMVSIRQFHGIEINDFAVTVAKTALWIAESQMIAKTERITGAHYDFLPLKSYDGVRLGNALRMDWNEVCPKIDYIMGNPPFVGARLMSEAQKDDLLCIFGKMWKNIGNIDYVGGWYKKAADLMAGTPTKTALVSTNSITQGEQVANLWKPLFADGVKIDFAYRTFRWDSEASLKAHVHCVIVGFSTQSADNEVFVGGGQGSRLIVSELGEQHKAKNINAYLIDGPDIFVESRSKPVCDVPAMLFGSMPNDGGNLILTEEEANYYKNRIEDKSVVRLFLGADEFINSKRRYCLWLVGVSPSMIKKEPELLKRIEAVRKIRLDSKRQGTRIKADTPTLFGEVRQPTEGNYLIIPRVSSEKRAYVPIGFMSADVIASDAVQIIPSATLYHFGVLTSSAHNSWMRAVCGRLKSDYRYSKDIVYNNFVWPEVSEEQRQKVEKAAQAILDSRTLYPDSTLADLYDETLMPPELRRAHRTNDETVLALYGLPKDATEEQIVSHLMELYVQKA